MQTLDLLLKVADIYKLPLIPEPYVMSEPSINYYIGHNVPVISSSEKLDQFTEMLRSVIRKFKENLTEIWETSAETLLGPQFRAHRKLPFVGSCPESIYEVDLDHRLPRSITVIKKERMTLEYLYVSAEYELLMQSISEGKAVSRLDMVSVIKICKYLFPERPVTIEEYL